MPIPTLTELIPILQIAIGPVILISGIGLLLLSMTNRLGRAVDRVRELHRGLQQADGPERENIHARLSITRKHAGLIRLAIVFAAVSILLAAVLIITLFTTAFLRIESSAVIILLFTGCLLALIVSMILFIWDINLGLAALNRDVGDIEG